MEASAASAVGLELDSSSGGDVGDVVMEGGGGEAERAGGGMGGLEARARALRLDMDDTLENPVMVADNQHEVPAEIPTPLESFYIRVAHAHVQKKEQEKTARAQALQQAEAHDADAAADADRVLLTPEEAAEAHQARIGKIDRLVRAAQAHASMIMRVVASCRLEENAQGAVRLEPSLPPARYSEVPGLLQRQRLQVDSRSKEERVHRQLGTVLMYKRRQLGAVAETLADAADRIRRRLSAERKFWKEARDLGQFWNVRPAPQAGMRPRNPAATHLHAGEGVATNLVVDYRFGNFPSMHHKDPVLVYQKDAHILLPRLESKYDSEASAMLAADGRASQPSPYGRALALLQAAQESIVTGEIYHRMIMESSAPFPLGTWFEGAAPHLHENRVSVEAPGLPPVVIVLGDSSTQHFTVQGLDPTSTSLLQAAVVSAVIANCSVPDPVPILHTVQPKRKPLHLLSLVAAFVLHRFLVSQVTDAVIQLVSSTASPVPVAVKSIESDSHSDLFCGFSLTASTVTAIVVVRGPTVSVFRASSVSSPIPSGSGAGSGSGPASSPHAQWVRCTQQNPGARNIAQSLRHILQLQ